MPVKILTAAFGMAVVTLLASCAGSSQSMQNYEPYRGDVSEKTRVYYGCKAESDKILYGPGGGMMAAYSAVQYMDSCMLSAGYRRVRR
jgi:hypothetical protein